MIYKFIHIPKTGGTALKRSLIPGYRKHPKDQKLLKTVIPDVYYGDHSVKLDKDGQYILWVRDPVKQFVSSFLFQRYRGQGYDTDGYFSNLKEPNRFRKYYSINELVMDIGNVKLMRLGWTLANAVKGIDNLLDCLHNLYFVGTTENLESDFYRLQDKLGAGRIPLARDYENRMPDKFKQFGILNDKAEAKLREWLAEDYKIINILKHLGMVSNDYLRR